MSSIQHLTSDIGSCDLPHSPLHIHNRMAKSVSKISSERGQPQELWYYTGGLKRHFYFNVEMNNAQVETRQSYARLHAGTPEAIMLSGKKERKPFGQYTLAGAWNERPYYRNAGGYHLFYSLLVNKEMHVQGWCID